MLAGGRGEIVTCHRLASEPGSKSSNKGGAVGERASSSWRSSKKAGSIPAGSLDAGEHAFPKAPSLAVSQLSLLQVAFLTSQDLQSRGVSESQVADGSHRPHPLPRSGRLKATPGRATPALHSAFTHNPKPPKKWLCLLVTKQGIDLVWRHLQHFVHSHLSLKRTGPSEHANTAQMWDPGRRRAIPP